MTQKLTVQEINAIFNLAVGQTEGYKVPYSLTNIWSKYNRK